MPCYNPKGDWVNAIIHSFNKLADTRRDLSLHLTVVDDGSSQLEKGCFDKLSDSIQGVNIILSDVNQGKGATLRKGMQACKSEFILFTDIDFPYENDSMVRMLDELVSGNKDIVIGKRSGVYYDQISENRKKVSLFLRGLNKHLMQIPVNDTQSGLKAMNSKGKEIFLSTKTNRYLVDLEFLKKAFRNKDIRIQQIPIYLKSEVELQKLNLKTLFSEGFSFLKILLTA